MVKDEILNQIFKDMQEHLLMDDKPSVYFNRIREEDYFEEFPFRLLSRMKDIPQSPIHHPEGSVWNHTMLVIDEAAHEKEKSNNQETFMWAALLHDIGKAETTRNKKGRITAYNHEKAGAEQAKNFLQVFLEDRARINQIVALVRWHMQVLFVVKSMSFADVKAMKQEVDLKEVALLGYCDRMGRFGADSREEQEITKMFLKKCNET